MNLPGTNTSATRNDSAGMWGSIAGAVSNITTTLITNSPKNRDANVAIAEANARAAEATGNGGTASKMDGKTIGIIAVIGVVVIIAVVLMSNKNK